MTEANQHNLSISKKNKKLILAIFASFLLVATIIAIVTGVNPHKKSTQNDAVHAILDSSTFSKSAFLLQVNRSIDAAESNNYTLSKKLATDKKLDDPQNTAIENCRKNNERIVSDLQAVFAANVDTKMTQAAQDVQTKFSSCLTNENSCWDGFSHSKEDKKALGMITSKPKAEMANGLKTTNRKLKEDDDSNETAVSIIIVTPPDVVVAADGSGNYTTVSAAVSAAPNYSSKRYIIRIKAGVYRENVEVPKEKSNIMFLGDGRKTTIITGSRSVAGGSTTYQSATVAVEGQGFLARDITFQNTAGPSNILAAVFQDCDIRARRPNPGQTVTITAQGRSNPTQNTGIVIQKCRIGVTSDLHAVRSNFSAYLGRPWKEYARTVVMQSSISDVIHPAGWNGLKGLFTLNTLSFAEYENSGAGAETSRRVTWEGYKMITSATEAQSFTARNFIGGSSWLKSTTFPFSLDL
uniref:Pectinesterase n=1 Tax=Salix viminalis TaxID=40686 RepID=A0A6N2KZC2_SALVM